MLCIDGEWDGEHFGLKEWEGCGWSDMNVGDRFGGCLL